MKKVPLQPNDGTAAGKINSIKVGLSIGQSSKTASFPSDLKISNHSPTSWLFPQ
jgi:hypothetical protein